VLIARWSLFGMCVSRLNDESMNDKNDRAIRKTAQFFQDSLVGSGSAILITNDEQNKQLAVTQCLQAYSLRSYVQKYLSDYPELFDLLSTADLTADSSDASSAGYFPKHLPMNELIAGINAKKYLKGCLRVKRDHWHDCYVVVYLSDQESSRRSVTISGARHVNRAIDGDMVAIELISSAEANRLSSDDLLVSDKAMSLRDELVVSTETADASYEQIEGLSSLASSTGASTASSSATTELYGRVVGIMKRNWRQYAGSIDADSIELSSNSSLEGTIDESTYASSDSFLFYPVDQKLPPIRISSRRKDDILYHRLLVTIDHWPANSKYPEGHYVKIIGKDGERDTETAVLLHEFGVPSNTFSTEVMACLPPLNWSIETDIKTIENRVDLRHLPIVSIDPPGCKDIDDALHWQQLPNGNIQVGVHIADVTYFVHPETPLDREAAHRSTSTYLVERRLDMLPGYLTTQLCSLRSDEDHLAFSVIWEMTSKGEIVDVSFFKSIIHSVASLTYDQAQSMLDHPTDYSKYQQIIVKSVNELNRLAKIFRHHRIEQGALTLASPEVRFKLDDQTSNPSDVTAYALKESNALVEEFMLLANITVS
jgi:exosome complex exonuclease DIS3/RRP44